MIKEKTKYVVGYPGDSDLVFPLANVIMGWRVYSSLQEAEKCLTEMGTTRKAIIYKLVPMKRP